MLAVTKLVPRGAGLAPALRKRAAAVVLDWDTRCRSRFEAEDSQGRRLGVFLPRGSVVRGGDVLVAEDGSLVKVIATPQPVLVVRTCAEHGTAFDLLRAAYHLGNRHVALELQPDRLQLEPDPVLAELLRRMHLVVTEELAPFEPEVGAYATQGLHAHGPHGTHGHGREHHDGHDDAPQHDHDHGHGGNGHGHGHDHGHGLDQDHRPDQDHPGQGQRQRHDPHHGQGPARDPAHGTGRGDGGSVAPGHRERSDQPSSTDADRRDDGTR